MAKLNSLTEEQEVLMFKIKQEWLDRALGGSDEINTKKASKGINWLYSKSGFSKNQMEEREFIYGKK